MAVVIRADGKEKVTGVGRYAADLTLTGLLHGRFKYADIGHARIRAPRYREGAGLPGVFAVITQDNVPDVRYGLSSRTGRCSRRTSSAGKARSSPRVARRDAGDREAGRRPDRGRLRAAAGRPRSREGDRARRPDRSRRMARVRGRRTRRARRQHRVHLEASSRAMPPRLSPRPMSSSRAASSPTDRRPRRSSPRHRRRMARRSASRSGRRRRSRSPPVPSCPRPCRWRRTPSASGAAPGRRLRRRVRATSSRRSRRSQRRPAAP